MFTVAAQESVCVTRGKNPKIRWTSYMQAPKSAPSATDYRKSHEIGGKSWFIPRTCCRTICCILGGRDTHNVLEFMHQNTSAIHS